MVRSHPEWERSYTGIVELASGEIAEDIAKYLVESEQQNAAIALGVSINRDARIRAAGGFLIQVRAFAVFHSILHGRHSRGGSSYCL